MKTLIVLLGIFAGFQTFAADPLYQVIYYSSEKNGDFVQSLLADWSGQDLGPAKFYPPAQGSRYFYFQLDQEVVEDLFHDLSEKGDLYVEKVDNPKPVPKGKAQFVLWFFPDRGDAGFKPHFAWSKGSSSAAKRRDQIVAKFQSLGLTTALSEKWRNTFWFSATPDQFMKTLSSGDLLNGNLVVDPSVRANQVQVLVTVRDVRSQDGEAIEEGTPSKAATEGYDFDFRLLPAMPLESSDVSELEKDLEKVAKKFDDDTSKGDLVFDVELEAARLPALLMRVGQLGLLRLSGVNNRAVEKKVVKVRIASQEPDDVLKAATDVPDAMGGQIQDKYKTELDLMYSGTSGQGTGKWISAVDVTLRRWIGRFGIKGNYTETAGAPSTDHSQLLGALVQYRFHWKKARYGQSLIPGFVYKQIRSSAATGQFGGVGLAYTDDMWKSVAWAFDLVPWFRRPKTVELNVEYLPLTTGSTIKNPNAVVVSLKGFVHRSQRLKLIGAFYYHNFSYNADEFSNGVRVANSAVSNSLYSIQFGLGFRF